MDWTKRTRLIVELLITRYKVNALIDSPCGGMLWMPTVIDRVHHFIPKFRYLGVDVVPSVIAKHKAKFASKPWYNFVVMDMSSQKLPSGYDMIWSRDTLQHMPFNMIISTLENFATSGVRYLAVGSYSNGGNRNISDFEFERGQSFPIDLRKSPFNLDKPIDILAEETQDGKIVLIYDASYLKNIDFGIMRDNAAAI